MHITDLNYSLSYWMARARHADVLMQPGSRYTSNNEPHIRLAEAVAAFTEISAGPVDIRAHRQRSNRTGIS